MPFFLLFHPMVTGKKNWNGLPPPDVNFGELSRSCEDFNGAQLKAVCVEGGMIALRREKTVVCHEVCRVVLAFWLSASTSCCSPVLDLICVFFVSSTGLHGGHPGGSGKEEEDPQLLCMSAIRVDQYPFPPHSSSALVLPISCPPPPLPVPVARVRLRWYARGHIPSLLLSSVLSPLSPTIRGRASHLGGIIK